jgi:hypothetical protein
LPLLGFVIRLKKIMADCTSSKKFWIFQFKK